MLSNSTKDQLSRTNMKCWFIDAIKHHGQLKTEKCVEMAW